MNKEEQALALARGLWEKEYTSTIRKNSKLARAAAEEFITLLTQLEKYGKMFNRINQELNTNEETELPRVSSDEYSMAVIKIADLKRKCEPIFHRIPGDYQELERNYKELETLYEVTKKLLLDVIIEVEEGKEKMNKQERLVEEQRVWTTERPRQAGYYWICLKTSIYPNPVLVIEQVMPRHSNFFVYVIGRNERKNVKDFDEGTMWIGPMNIPGVPYVGKDE